MSKRSQNLYRNPLQAAISTGAISVDAGVGIKRDPELLEKVVTGQATPQEAASAYELRVAGHKAAKDAVGFDVTHRILKVLDAVLDISLEDYNAALTSKENANKGFEVESTTEEVKAHLAALQRASRTLEVTA